MSMLQSLGIECGQSLIPAGPGNETGFWENARIVEVQENLLAKLGRVWHGPMGTHPLPRGWLDTAPAKRARDQLVRIVLRELGETDGVWGFKDPRTTRLLPLWQSVFAEAGAEPHYILSVRHPASVCRSLNTRNGVDLERGQLVWLLYNLDGYRDAGASLRLVVDYDAIVGDPEGEVARMAQALSPCTNIGAEERAAAAARVEPSMRRYGFRDPAIANSIVRSAHEGLQSLARDEQPGADFEHLLEVYRDMEDLYAPWRRDTRSLALDWALRLLVRGKYA